jgi:hypothetical protein
MKEMKLPVTERAILQRVNRRLAAQGQKLFFYRSGTMTEFRDGAYVVIDLRKQRPVDGKPVNLEALARKLDVMEEFETPEQ